MLKIIEKTKLWFAISLTIIIIGIAALFVNGLQLGIDFKGGALMEVDFGKVVNQNEVRTIVNKYTKNYDLITLNKTGVQIKSGSLTSAQTADIFKDLKTKYNLKDTALISNDTVSASVGQEVLSKALWALLIANVLMLLYIGVRFEFKFGAAAMLALVHDVLITFAVYTVFKLKVDSSFIAAMLTIIGYSINDTIVVFDRIRENQKYMRGSDVTELADASITQTMTRSINTVLTVLITLVCVHIFVPTVRTLTIPLLVGIVSGCYSSIFIASPLWVIFKHSSEKRKKAASEAREEQRKAAKQAAKASKATK